MEKTLYIRCPDCKSPVSLYLSSYGISADNSTGLRGLGLSRHQEKASYTLVPCVTCSKQVPIYVGLVADIDRGKRERKPREVINIERSNNYSYTRPNSYETAMFTDGDSDALRQSRTGVKMRKTPARAPTLISDVFTPAMRALIGGTLVQVIVWIVFYAIWGWTLFYVWLFMLSWSVFIFISWTIDLHGFNNLLYTLEEFFEPEKDEDQEPIPEEHYVHMVEFDEHSKDKRIHTSLLPIIYSQYEDICYAVIYQGANLSKNTWVRKGPLTDKDYTLFVNYLLTEKLIKLVKAGGGGETPELTTLGKRTFKSVANQRTRIE